MPKEQGRGEGVGRGWGDTEGLRHSLPTAWERTPADVAKATALPSHGEERFQGISGRAAQFTGHLCLRTSQKGPMWGLVLPWGFHMGHPRPASILCYSWKVGLREVQELI